MFESEERQISERIKDFIKSKNPSFYHYIILRDGRILEFVDYRSMIISGKITPHDAYVEIRMGGISSKTFFYYPFLEQYIDFSDTYLSKLGFYYGDSVVPATGLKYVAVTAHYKNYLTIEVSSLDIIASSTNLRKIVFEVLDGKLISGEKELIWLDHDKIRGMFRSQRLFGDHNVSEARNIIDDYYDNDNKSLSKEVARITFDYERIFQPYRACYDMGSWDEVDCLSIKLD